MIHKNIRTDGGFTLVELLIVVVIIGILATIAYPSYSTYVRQTRRSDAYTALSQIANNLEKFYSQCSSYTTDIKSATSTSCTTPAGGTLGLGASGDQSPNQYYLLTIAIAGAGVPPGGYVVTATAQGQQSKDTDCRTITLDSTGAKKAKNSSSIDTSTTCWKK